MAARAEDRAAATAASARAAKRSGRASLSRVAPDADLSALLGGAAKGSDSAAEEGIDASPAGGCRGSWLTEVLGRGTAPEGHSKGRRC